jgi:hypothetical protein
VVLGVAGGPFAFLSGLGCGTDEGAARPAAGGGGSGNEVGSGGAITTDANGGGGGVNSGGGGANAGSRDGAIAGLGDAASIDAAAGTGGSSAGHLDANSADGDRSDAQSGTSDAGPDVQTGSGSFGNPVLVETTSGPLSDPAAQNKDPTFTADELELFFMSDRGTHSQDIWTARRTAKNLAWDPPTRVNELSSPNADDDPSVSSLDGLTLWFDSNRDDTGNGFDVWVSKRPSRQNPWNSPERVAEVNSAFEDKSPAVDDAELIMLFVSNRPGGPGGRDIYISRRQIRSDPWGAPVPLAGVVNGPGDEVDPFLGAHGLQVFWAANMGAGEEIRWSARSSVVEPFSSFAVLGELGRPSFDPKLSVDLRHIMFTSGRSGSNQIYEAFR